MNLDAIEVRILGSLIEKESATPEYYPLTLNALLNACNQKSNRDPVVSYDEDTVLEAIGRLRRQGLATEITGAGMRVPKYTQRLSEQLNLGRRELALLCMLMLRGRQTAAELRDRSERLHHFADSEEAQTCLNRLTEMESPLALRLPRQPGEKEVRFMHLLSGTADTSADEPRPPHQTVSLAPGTSSRLEGLETEVLRLRDELEQLKSQFADFRRQFE